MSPEPPERPSRSRRRIAGERRPRRPAGQGPGEEAAAPPSEDEEASKPAGPGQLASYPPPSPATARRPETGEGSATASPGRDPGRGPSWLLVALVGALALALVVAAAVLGLGVWDVRDVRAADRVDDASQEAPAAAERASAAILSYDYKTLDADEKAAERYLTPAYGKKYAETFRLVRTSAAKLHAKVQAEVKASGVTRAEEDRATVLLYVDQTTTSTAHGGEPQVALNRVQLSMVKRGGAWLVDDVTSY